MDALVEPIRQYAASASDVSRRDLISYLHGLAYSLETADDTLHRYGSMVPDKRAWQCQTQYD
jgi:hypothetical protein